MSPGRGQKRKTEAAQFIYGLRPVLESLRMGRRRIARVFLAGRTDAVLTEIIEAAAQAGVPVASESREGLTRLAGSPDHQGAVASVGPLPVCSLEELSGESSPDGEEAFLPPVILVLDGVIDPRNFGALCRSALALGCWGVVFPKDRSAGPTPAAVKASAGAIERIPLIRVTNLSRALDQLKERNFWIVGLAETGDHWIEEIWCDGPMALVVGSEGKGLRRLVRERCDQVMRLDTSADFSTLNVSVAGAIALYEVNTRRKGKGNRRSQT